MKRKAIKLQEAAFKNHNNNRQFEVGDNVLLLPIPEE
jgi:hypothetical protein